MWKTWGVWVRLAALSALCLGSLAGCIGAPGIPGGPLQGTGVSMSANYGYALGPAHVSMRSPSDGRRGGFTDSAGDAVNLPIVPSRLGGRLGITKWFDVAGDSSLLDGGLEARVGLPEGAEPFPMALSLGLRSGNWGVLSTTNRQSSEQRVRLEAYPQLAKLHYLRVNLISTVGMSTGRRYHPLDLPAEFQRRDDFDEVPGPSFDPQILRDETRLEASGGIELRQKYFFASFVLMPYVVTGAKRATVDCRQCDTWQVDGFRQDFGAALFVSLGTTILFSNLLE